MLYDIVSCHSRGAFINWLTEVLLECEPIKDLFPNIVEGIHVHLDLVVHDNTLNIIITAWLRERSCVMIEREGEPLDQSIIH